MLHPVGHTYSNGWKILICQEISHFRVALSSVSKRVLVNNLLHGNEQWICKAINLQEELISI